MPSRLCGLLFAHDKVACAGAVVPPHALATCLFKIRSHVLALLPRLKMLDGRPVSGEELSLSVQVVAQEEARMAVMLSNACTVHKMVGGWVTCMEQNPLGAQGGEANLVLLIFSR